MSVYLLLLIFVYIPKFTTRDVLATISVIDKGIFPLEKDSVAIQFYLDIENRNPSRVCRVLAWPNRCCINNPNDSDCTPMKVFGHFKGFVREKDRDTLVFVLPSLHQHDLYGSCDFNIVHQCDKNTKHVKRTVEIHLDTRLRKHTNNELLLDYIGGKKLANCDNIDEDSLQNCEAADCDMKYLGAKSYYDNDIHRCVEVTSCTSDTSKELPNSVYLPFSNMCRDYDRPITMADIYAISTRMGVVTESPITKMENTIELRPNCTTVSQNILLLWDMLNGKLCKMTGGSDYGKCCRNAILAILKCIGFLLLFVLGSILFLIIVTWLWMKWHTGEFVEFVDMCKCTFKKSKDEVQNMGGGKIIANTSTHSVINKQVTNQLLKEVITRDIPMELRDGVVNICSRIDDHVREKKRYRSSDLGSQISLNDTIDSSSEDPEEDERTPLVK
ncbi:uncharacterized protein LOC128673704 [Plodia interpunctella]|uniref:uncharacterized protein LOC128673704 n=1 Tax=Plodia interpunctella TaxID=58824 RepID=UPI0023682D2D|nr:uncharacterized protein LOC128673704 [Plodia interpunctella]